MNQFLRALLAVGLAGLVISAFPLDGNQSASAQSGNNPWTDWLDRDNPSAKGDYETVRDFLKEGLIQPNPVGIECRTIEAPGAPSVNWNATGQVYSCTPERGGVCVNAEQTDGRQCLDYKVRFRYKGIKSQAEEEHNKKK